MTLYQSALPRVERFFFGALRISTLSFWSFFGTWELVPFSATGCFE